MYVHGSTYPGSCLSGGDAITLLEVIHRSLSCGREEEFVGLFSRLQELFPFDFSYAMMGHMERSGLVIAHGVNVSFPEGWLNEYSDKNYFQVDAVLRENFQSYEVQNWSVARKELYRKKEITSLGMDFGMRECFTHGWRPSAPGGEGSMFCFSGRTMEDAGRTRAILDVVTPHLHLALGQVRGHRSPEMRDAALSAREREVLHWLKHGKSSWEISVILHISERTVNFHVHNIMAKLGATNRPQAVALAARLGVIDIS